MANNDQGTFIGVKNHVEASSTTFTTAVLEFGDRVASNLATTQSDDAWRVGALSGGSTSAQVTIEFTAERSVDALSTQFPRGIYPGVSEDEPNFAATDTIRYRLYDASDVELYDSTAQASGVVPGYMLHTVELDQSYQAKKLVVDFDAVSRAAATFFDVASIGAWETISPSVGFAYPGGFGWKLNNESQTTIAGRTYTARFEPKRRWSIVFDFLSNADSLQIDEMIRYSGGARQVLIQRGDLPTGKDAMLALVSPSRDMESRTATLRQQALTFEEFI